MLHYGQCVCTRGCNVVPFENVFVDKPVEEKIQVLKVQVPPLHVFEGCQGHIEGGCLDVLDAQGQQHTWHNTAFEVRTAGA